MLNKIVSGALTGAGPAALDFAIRHKIMHGGWVPKGRIAEDGILHKKYKLTEMPKDSYMIMDKTLSDLIEYCKSNNRIFLKDTYWSYLYDFLPPNTSGEKPPYPWDNCPWEDFFDSLTHAELEQQKLFLQHVEWAYYNGAIERCDRFLRSLIEEDRWIHVGEYTGGH